MIRCSLINIRIRDKKSRVLGDSWSTWAVSSQALDTRGLRQECPVVSAPKKRKKPDTLTGQDGRVGGRCSDRYRPHDGTVHRRTVWSRLPEAASRPPGANATLVTAPAWPRKQNCSRPPAASHSRTVPSRPPDRARVPSGENATLLAPCGCTLNPLASRPCATSHMRRTWS